jgi:hypothetical protein
MLMMLDLDAAAADIYGQGGSGNKWPRRNPHADAMMIEYVCGVGRAI